MLQCKYQNDIKQHQENVMEEPKQVLLRLPESVLSELDKEASNARRSRTAQVTVILEERYGLSQLSEAEAA
jgi:hypothetical protein